MLILSAAFASANRFIDVQFSTERRLRLDESFLLLATCTSQRSRNQCLAAPSRSQRGGLPSFSSF